MQIACTKKLLDTLKIMPGDAPIVDPLFAWTGHYINISRRKALVLVNNATYTTVLFYGIKATDLKDMESLVVKGIKETFEVLKIKPKITEEYLAKLSEFNGIIANKDRKITAQMNKICSDAQDLVTYNLEHEEFISPQEIIAVLNNVPRDGEKPQTRMIEQLKTLTGKEVTDATAAEPVAKQKGEPLAKATPRIVAGAKGAVEILATLNLGKEFCSRKLLVPAYYNFAELHFALQVAFIWDDIHEYSFHIEDGLKKINILTTMAEGKPGTTNLLAAEANVGELLAKHKKLSYVYDQADKWVHNIKVLNVLEDVEQPYTRCLAGSGDTPPESVGGINGHMKMKKILANPKSKEYEEAYNIYREKAALYFDLEKVNKMFQAIYENEKA